MPEISAGYPMGSGDVSCPLCDSTNVTLLEESNMIIEYICEDCSHQWEEYK